MSPYGVILWLPLGLGLGILIFFGLSEDPDWRHMALAAGVFVTCLVTLILMKKPAGWPLMCLLIALGFSLATFKAHVLCGGHPMLQSPLEHQWCEGVILEVEATTKGYRYVVEMAQLSSKRKIEMRQVLERSNPSIEESFQSIPAQGMSRPHTFHLNKVRVSTQSRQERVQVGDKVRFLGTLLPLSGPVVPQGYDFRRQAYFQGLNGVGFLEGRFWILGHEKDLRHHINGLRALVRQKIQAHIPGPQGAIATALITGERAPISGPINEAFNNSGLAHILSISGLHFSILAGLVFFTCRRLLSLLSLLANRYDLKKVAAWVVIAISLFYALIAGGSVPVVRSFIMILAAMVAVLMDRDPISMRLVALAATCILVISPEALLTASFQMSFAAVIGLVAFYDYWQKQAHHGHSKLWIVVTSTLLTTVVASLATAPFTLYHFGRVTLYAVIANALAVPLTAFWIMPCILLSLLLMPFGGEGWVCTLLDYGLQGLIYIAEQVAKLPHSTVVMPPLPAVHGVGFMSMTVMGGLLLCLGATRWRKGAVGIILASGLWLLGAKPYDVLLQKQPFALMVRTQTEAFGIGKLQPFLREQWSKALGVEPETLVCAPLCDQPGHHSGQRCVRQSPFSEGGLRVLGAQVQVSETGNWHVNGREVGKAQGHAFRWETPAVLAPIPWPESRRKWAR